MLKPRERAGVPNRASQTTRAKRLGRHSIDIISFCLAAFFVAHAADAAPKLFTARPVVPGSLSAQSLTGLAGVGESEGFSPYWDWKEIETDHFRITYPAELAAVAQKSAGYLEEAHRALSPFLKWETMHKTQICIVDNTDLANGLTAATGRIGIVLVATPPENFFSTGYYDDWLRLLVFHEYTHMVNMDTSRGAWSVFRFLFGDVALANSLWPTWMLEGLAVYDETRFTDSGRGRSPFYEMILRSAVEENALDDSRFITLDKVNGPNPYPPTGETDYLFGYQMMNQITRQKLGGQTADGETRLAHPEDALGEMSWRSAGRFPYLISGNLKNIIGKDFPDLWAEWVTETRARLGAQLAQLKAKPVTPFTPLTSPATELLGSSASPDGKWLAYTQETSDREMSLYLRDLATGATRILDEKLLGTTMSFSPDSRKLYYSAVERRGLYYLFSDLFVYDLERHSIDRLTTRLRARDPALSRDGAQVAFTITDHQTTSLAVARVVSRNDGRDVSLADIQVIHRPKPLGRVSTPVFSADGRSVIFSQHENGTPAEDLFTLELATKTLRPLAQNGKMNRFPAVDPEGAIYYVSDVTGIDNLFRVNAAPGTGSTQFTNVTTGLALPTFVPTGDRAKPRLFADHFTYRGWEIAELGTTPTAAQGGLKPSELTVSAPPAPMRPASPAPGSPASATAAAADTRAYPERDYSIWPSILPRQWLLLPTLDYGSVYTEAEVAGFDALDVHRYLLGGGYDTLTHQFDALAYYENRQLGPTISASYSETTTHSYRVENGSSYDLIDYERERQATLSISLPIQYTYSALTPYVGFNIDRSFLHVPGFNPGGDDVIAKTSYVPTADAILFFSNALSSRLATGAEQGRSTALGNRVYFEGGQQVYKGYFSDTEYLRVTDHSVLMPEVKASMVSRTSRYGDANVLVEGRAERLISSLPADGFNQLAIRGYPELTYYSRGAVMASLDYRFPIFRIFRGWGTNPLFFEQFYGFVFGEAAYFPFHEGGLQTLPSTGGGVNLQLDALVHIPIILSGQYHRGLRTDQGGVGETIFQIGLGNLGF